LNYLVLDCFGHLFLAFVTDYSGHSKLSKHPHKNIEFSAQGKQKEFVLVKCETEPNLIGGRNLLAIATHHLNVWPT
jgi:hypothetical protein